jgi:hypothetical protein
LAAIEMIKNYLEEYPDTLQNYKLEIEVREHECKPDLALKSLISIYQKRDSLIGVIGPCKKINLISIKIYYINF